jgi:hypothetical protein
LLFAVQVLNRAVPAGASDHADPIFLEELEAGITDLFAFPKDDKLVLMLCVRRALTTGPPVPLEPYTYAIHIDHHSEVNFDDEDVNARYGGKIIDPSGIRPDVTIKLQLTNDVKLRKMTIEGLPDPMALEKPFVGIRDDPFIFFRFLTTNVVAMVLEIPFAQFPEGRQEFVLWGTSSRFGRQVDHVGRSLRTMLPRLDFLNTLPPKDHVPTLRERHTNPGVIQDILATRASSFFGIRHYDFEPDVMIFSRQREAKYPNGRQLEDDVAAHTCQYGDCLLYEVSLAEAHAEGKPRPTANNKPFLTEFPYLAEPNPERPPRPMPRLKTRTRIILAIGVIAVLILFLLPWLLLWRCSRRFARLRASMMPASPA